MEAGNRQEVGEARPLEEGVGFLEALFIPQEEAFQHLAGGRGKPLAQPLPKGTPGVGQGGEGRRPFHVKHPPHPPGQKPGPLVKTPGVALGSGGARWPWRRYTPSGSGGNPFTRRGCPSHSVKPPRTAKLPSSRSP